MTTSFSSTLELAFRTGRFARQQTAKPGWTNGRFLFTVFSRHSSTDSSWKCRRSKSCFVTSQLVASRLQCQRSTFPLSRGLRTRRNIKGAQASDSETRTNLEDSKGDQEEEYRESDSLYKILWGEPQPTPAELEQTQNQWPETFAEWKEVLSKSWLQYRLSWEGFFSNHGAEDGKKDEGVFSKGIDFELDVDELRARQKEMQKNMADSLGRNLNTIEKEGTNLTELAKDKTGIHSKEELAKWAGDQIKLATACLNQFMSGYREGRDDEVDNMLNEYFKEFDSKQEEEVQKKPVGGETDAKSDTVVEKVAKKKQEEEVSSEDIQKRKGGRRRRKRVVIAR